jgi:1-acyl-sn-glycerol-3-phosphate acyltransferase
MRVALPLRIVGLAALIVAGLAITGLTFRWLRQTARNRALRRWSRLLLAVCGTRLRVTGTPLTDEVARTGIAARSRGRLVLANHVSWIDVYAINAAVPSRFVAKAEIGDWPLIGTLVTLTGTLYIERGRRHAVAAMNHRVSERLKAGETVAVFPEGTTTDGTELLPFHSNLIAPALDVGCEIWPVALRYTEDGQRSKAAAFVGDMGLLTSLWNILLARRLEVEVAFLPPLATAGERNRHHLAHQACSAIAGYLDVPAVPARAQLVSRARLAPAPAMPADPDGAGTAPEPQPGPATPSR